MLDQIRISAGGRPQEGTEIEVHLKHGPSAIAALTAPVGLTSKSNNLNVVTLIHCFQINTVLRIDAETTVSPPRLRGTVRSGGKNRNSFYLSHGYHFPSSIIAHKEMRLENLGPFSVIADATRLHPPI